MWAHYGGNHRGFIIGIRPEPNPLEERAFIWSEYRTEIDLTSLHGFGSFRDVEYDNEPFRIPFGGDVPFGAFFRKGVEWSHEREVRIFRSVYDATKTTVVDGKRLYLFAIPHDAIAHVVIGAEATTPVREAATAFARRLGTAAVDQAVLDHRARKMKFEQF